jgi:hypothetical protein
MPHRARLPLQAAGAALLAAVSICAWPAHADAPAGTYTATDTTATDTNTGLEWQRTPLATATSQAGAVSACTALGGGWRLPSVLELVSLVDEERAAAPTLPAIDPVFTATGEYFWSATPYAGSGTPANGWAVNFDNGDTLPQPITLVARVRCVR